MNIRMSVPVTLLALSAGIAFGQATNSADVTGTVTDSTGAVVPGVTIAIKDVDKGEVRTITSNGAGAYDTARSSRTTTTQSHSAERDLNPCSAVRCSCRSDKSV